MPFGCTWVILMMSISFSQETISVRDLPKTLSDIDHSKHPGFANLTPLYPDGLESAWNKHPVTPSESWNKHNTTSKVTSFKRTTRIETVPPTLQEKDQASKQILVPAKITNGNLEKAGRSHKNLKIPRKVIINTHRKMNPSPHDSKKETLQSVTPRARIRLLNKPINAMHAGTVVHSKHFPFHLQNSMKESISLFGNKANIECVMEGPKDFLVIWRMACDLTTPRRIAKEEIGGSIQHDLIGAGTDWNKAISVFSYILQNLEGNCYIYCCGYSEDKTQQNITRHRNYNMSVAYILRYFTPTYLSSFNISAFDEEVDIISPDAPPEALRGKRVAGECKGIRMGEKVNWGEETSLRALLLYGVMIICGFSVGATIICLCLSDGKSNRYKKRVFKKWIRTRQEHKETKLAVKASIQQEPIRESTSEIQMGPEATKSVSSAQKSMSWNFPVGHAILSRHADLRSIASGVSRATSVDSAAKIPRTRPSAGILKSN